MKSPSIYTLKNLANAYSTDHPRAKIGNAWYPARPLGFASPWLRLRAAWLVFTGRADAVIWPGGQ